MDIDKNGNVTFTGTLSKDWQTKAPKSAGYGVKKDTSKWVSFNRNIINEQIEITCPFTGETLKGHILLYGSEKPRQQK